MGPTASIGQVAARNTRQAIRIVVAGCGADGGCSGCAEESSPAELSKGCGCSIGTPVEDKKVDEVAYDHQ